MQIKTSFISRVNGEKVETIYKDIDNLSEISDLKISSARAICFCGDKIVLVYADKKGVWGPPAGGLEPGEDAETAIVREVKEETNMKVLKKRIIGLQTDSSPSDVKNHAVFVCLVEPYGPFVADEDGEEPVTKIELITPKDYKKYFNWGANLDRMIEISLILKTVL